MADKQTGRLVQHAIIMTLSSSMTFPKPTPPPGGGTTPPPTGGQPPHPDHTLPGDLPHPEHPIYWPLPPMAPVDPEYGIPEGGQPPRPDQGLPQPPTGGGQPPRPDQGLPQPQPPTGGQPPHPDQGLPGPQPHPEHPIVLPPDGGGWGPIFIWGPTDPRPTPPIVIPPDSQAPPEAPGKVKWKAVWTPSNGWQTIGVIVPSAPVPTPSKK